MLCNLPLITVNFQLSLRVHARTLPLLIRACASQPLPGLWRAEAGRKRGAERYPHFRRQYSRYVSGVKSLIQLRYPGIWALGQNFSYIYCFHSQKDFMRKY